MLHCDNAYLARKGLLLKRGSMVDATIIAAPSSTKNAEGERDPEMHQTKKGNQWYFGMKAHIGADLDSGLVRALALLGDGQEATATQVARQVLTTAREHGVGYAWSRSRDDGRHPPCLLAASDLRPANQVFLHEVSRMFIAPLATRTTALGQGSVDLPGGESLSARECEVLALLNKALSAKSIALTLGLSVGTIKWHLRNIYGKLLVTSREDALARARALRIIE